jgi:hypothetical protein
MRDEEEASDDAQDIPFVQQIEFVGKRHGPFPPRPLGSFLGGVMCAAGGQAARPALLASAYLSI